MDEDIHVYLRGGTYRLSQTLALGPNDSGFNGHVISYQAYPREVPIISGGIAVTGFTQYDAGRNIWRAPVPEGVTGRQVFVNGQRAWRTRTNGAPSSTATTAGGFTTSDGAYASYRNPTNIEVVKENYWKHMRCPLQSVATSTSGGSSLNVLPSCWVSNRNPPNLSFPFNGNGLPAMDSISWVENVYEQLTSAGQFYLDQSDSCLYYIPRQGEDLSTAAVELAELETLLTLAGTPAHLGPINDTDPAAVYTGTWTYSSSRALGDWGDDVHATRNVGDTVTYTFSGTGVEILGETNTDEGAFRIFVDGVEDTSVARTQTSSTRLAQQVIYSSQGLPKATHTVKLANAQAGPYTLVDAFVVAAEPIAPVHDITVTGITFSNATWKLPSTVGYIDNQAGVLWDTSGFIVTPSRIAAAVQVHRGTNISVVNDVLSHLGGNAVDLADGTQDSSVTGFIVQDTGGGGIYVGEVDDYFQTEPSLMTSGDVVSNNVVWYAGQDYRDAVGIWLGYTRNATVEHNDVGHNPYSGMSVGWGWGWASACNVQAAQGLKQCYHGTIYAGGNQVLNNYVHEPMESMWDGGPIYTNGGQGNGNGSVRSILSGNFVTMLNDSYHQLYLDEGSSYWNVYDNVASLGASDFTSPWGTEEYIDVGPINYSDTSKWSNTAYQTNVTAPVVVTDGNWPDAAKTIMGTAGLEPSYSSNLQGLGP
jgi:hypothetical protein